MLPPVRIEPGTSCDLLSCCLTELTWQPLIEGYLTSLLFVPQLVLDLDDLAEINRAQLYKDPKSLSLTRTPSYLSQVGIRIDHKRFQVQSPMEVTFFAEFILLFPEPSLPTLPLCIIKVKLESLGIHSHGFENFLVLIWNSSGRISKAFTMSIPRGSESLLQGTITTLSKVKKILRNVRSSENTFQSFNIEVYENFFSVEFLVLGA